MIYIAILMSFLMLSRIILSKEKGMLYFQPRFCLVAWLYCPDHPLSSLPRPIRRVIQLMGTIPTPMIRIRYYISILTALCIYLYSTVLLTVLFIYQYSIYHYCSMFLSVLHFFSILTAQFIHQHSTIYLSLLLYVSIST